METVAFLVVAVVLYVVADRILVLIERRQGARLPHRTVVFFFLLLGLALVAFPLLRRLLAG